MTEDRWREVGQGYQDVHTFMRSMDFSAFNMENRAELVRTLKDLSGASQRAIAETLGVSQATVSRDLASDSFESPDEEKAVLDLPLDGENDSSESPDPDEDLDADEEDEEPPSLDLPLDTASDAGESSEIDEDVDDDEEADVDEDEEDEENEISVQNA